MELQLRSVDQATARCRRPQNAHGTAAAAWFLTEARHTREGHARAL